MPDSVRSRTTTEPGNSIGTVTRQRCSLGQLVGAGCESNVATITPSALAKPEPETMTVWPPDPASGVSAAMTGPVALVPLLVVVLVTARPGEVGVVVTFRDDDIPITARGLWGAARCGAFVGPGPTSAKTTTPTITAAIPAIANWKPRCDRRSPLSPGGPVGGEIRLPIPSLSPRAMRGAANHAELT